MVSCNDCLHIDVCKNRYIFGDMPTCGYFKDSNRFIELPLGLKPKIKYDLKNLACDYAEARREITYQWNESYIGTKTSAQMQIDVWKSDETKGVE